MTIHLAPGLDLPDETVTDSAAVLGRRGSGKSYTASVLAEEMLEAGHQVVIIDPTGVWWGLRTSADGKGAGYEVVVLGGNEADVPLEPTAGELVADLIVDTRISAVLDLSLMRKGERTRFLTAFAERLFHRKGVTQHRTPLHLMVDEAHAFVPQRPQADQARMLGAGEDLVQMGRSRGIGVTLISQRPAVVNKNVLSQVAGVIALQLTAPQDRKALDAWLEEVADQDLRRQFVASLSGLDVGQAIVWFPHLQVFETARVRRRRTFDSSATPKVGERVTAPAGRADVDLEALEAAMADTIERAKADDPKELRRQIAQLNRDLEQARTDRPEPERVEVEVQVLDEDLVARLEEALAPVGGAVDVIAKAADQVAQRLADARQLGTPPRTPDRTARRTERASKPAPAQRRQAIAVDAGTDSGDVNLKAGARRMLDALARFHPGTMTVAQVATAAGVKKTGGTFGTYWSTLRRHDLVVEVDRDEWTITAAGFDAIGQVPDDTPLTRAELLDTWRPKLKAGARRMLDALVDAHPHDIPRDELAAEAGIEASGGTFGTYLGQLKRTGLVEVDGGVARMADLYEAAS